MARPNSISSTSSSSLTPRMTTVSIFNPPKSSDAAAMPSDHAVEFVVAREILKRS